MTARAARQPPPYQLKHATKIYESYAFPNPAMGWVSNEPLSVPQPGAAVVMENIFPLRRGARVRGGAARIGTTLGKKTESLMSYSSSTASILFGAGGGSIYNISAQSGPSLPVPVVTGKSGNDYSYVNFATAGGQFLIAVNGVDLHLIFDGSTWAVNTPAITGISSALFDHVWIYRNRLFFVERNTKNAWYLSVDSIGGAATKFPLDGVFKKGGKLLFGGSWSQDAGDGLDDKCLFISSLGEVAVYEGSNPSSPTDWGKVGLYEIDRPLGKHATMQVGGDLLIATVAGIVPISASVTKDIAALSLAAITRNIEPDWKGAVETAGDKPWRMVKWPEKNMGIVAVPINIITDTRNVWGPGSETAWGAPYVWGPLSFNSPDATAFVVNLETGAWCKYLGWDIQSLAYHENKVYFGNTYGIVLEAEKGGSDNGLHYVGRYAGWPDPMGMEGIEKQALMAKATFRFDRDFAAVITAAPNYRLNWSSPASALISLPSSNLWDAGLWDQARWSSGGAANVKDKWVSINRSGSVFSPMLQITVGQPEAPSIEFVSFHMTFEFGDMMV